MLNLVISWLLVIYIGGKKAKQQDLLCQHFVNVREVLL